ncbi:hypothetical protein RKE29_05125 [Streptomyces sp. B1866]|uniref:hypothetical protein n=1 Tax=Streptomyces sp. B1866 TaxID=3075431 RepID=UPI00288EF27C|nr:hypothetical protein [Streptomyces sp. B1866]MDT3396029.1 hypothetical protein [Streptomyces sp. B1866]
MSLVPPGITRVVFTVDIESYSRRLHLEQIRAQERLLRVVEHAFDNAGTEWFSRQDGGDSMLLVLRADIEQTRVVPRLLTGLREALEIDNRGRDASGRLRLRAALGEGTVHVAPTGFAGGQVIEVCRFLNSGPLKAALRASPERDLVTAVTDHIYQEIVRHGYPGLDPSGFREMLVDIPDKGFSARAWIDAPVPDPPAPAAERTGAPAPAPAGVPQKGPAAAGSPAGRERRRAPKLDVAMRSVEGLFIVSELGHNAEERHADHPPADHASDHHLADGQASGHRDAGSGRHHAADPGGRDGLGGEPADVLDDALEDLDDDYGDEEGDDAGAGDGDGSWDGWE